MDRKVDLFYSKNGSLQIVSEDAPLPVFSIFITLFCFLFGVTYNFIVISAVFSNKTLRSSLFHQLLALISITCLLDCLTNESVAFGLLLNNAISCCTLSAVVFQFFLLAHTSSVALLCLERTLLFYKRPMTFPVGILGEVSSWAFSLVFSLPLLAANEVHYFPNRNACGAVPKNIWAPTLFLFGVLLCWASGAVYIYIVVRTYRKQQDLTNFSAIPITSSPEIKNTSLPPVRTPDKVPSSLLFLHVVLLLPQTVNVVVTAFLPLRLEPDPWTDPRVLTNHAGTVLTHDLEPLFTFLRYMYNVAVPILTLSSDSAVRAQGRQIFCCRRNVISIDDSVSTISVNSPDTELVVLRSPSFKTPVLFVTSQGIHLRVPYRTNPDDSYISDDNLRLVTEFCDLFAEPIARRGFFSGCNDSTRTEDEDNSGENWRKPEVKRCVRFSSKLEALSPTTTTFGTFPVHSATHTVRNPIVVKGEVHWEETDKKL